MTFSTAVFGPELVAGAACRELSSVTVFWGNVCADTVVCVAATAGGGESEARAAISCALMSPTRTADVSDLK